jgi:hypothetical protein
MQWRHALEIGNGLWTIVAAYLVVFIAYHLIVVGAQRRLKIGDWLNLPLSMQLAFGTWVAGVGVLMTRAVVWTARYSNDGFLQLDDIETAVFSLGIFVGLAGFLCILRVATKPVLGHWPWVSCLTCCSFYLLWSLARIG